MYDRACISSPGDTVAIQHCESSASSRSQQAQSVCLQVKQAAVAALSQLLPEEQRPLPLDLVRVAASNSDVVPNGGPTWSSTGSEGNCQAVMKAGAKLVKQLKSHVKVWHGLRN